MIKEFKFDNMSFEEFGNMFSEFVDWYNEKYKDKIENDKKEAEKKRRDAIFKELCNALDENLRNISDLLHIIEKYEFSNEKYVIEWLDLLNKISVKH